MSKSPQKTTILQRQTKTEGNKTKEKQDNNQKANDMIDGSSKSLCSNSYSKYKWMNSSITRHRVAG